MNTTSLVNAVELQIKIDEHNHQIIPYSKIFVVFDRDSFKASEFDKAIKMCEKNGYIPLWSNQAIEFWFLLHFNYICSKMDRNIYTKKLNEYFKIAGIDYKYKKNDKDLYYKLCKYGSLEKARMYAKKIDLENKDKPSLKESSTTVYKFFDEIDNRLKELE